MNILHCSNSDQNYHGYRYCALFLKSLQKVEKNTNTLINWNNFTKIYVYIDLLYIEIVQIQNTAKSTLNKYKRTYQNCVKQVTGFLWWGSLFLKRVLSCLRYRGRMRCSGSSTRLASRASLWRKWTEHVIIDYYCHCYLILRVQPTDHKTHNLDQITFVRKGWIIFLH